MSTTLDEERRALAFVINTMGGRNEDAPITDEDIREFTVRLARASRGPTVHLGHVRSYPMKVQAEAFIDAMRLANQEGEFRVVQDTDRFSPTGYWFRVERFV